VSHDKPENPAPRTKAPWWRGLVRPAVVLVFGLMFVRFFGCAERLYFYPDRSVFQTPAAYEDMLFENAEGHTLHGWFIPPRGDVPEPWPTVLHVHGNAGNLTHHVAFCDWLADHGYAVMLFDYRSYGRSDTGKLTRDTVLLDANAALDALLAREDVDESRIAVFGFSLGGATAIRLTAERQEPAALVAGAPFSGWQRVAGDYVSALSKVLLPTGGDPIEAITRIGDRPVLLVHGLDDPIVRPYHTEVLEAAARNAGVPVTRTVFERLDHNTLLLDGGVRGSIVRFLDDAVSQDEPEGNP
jgi:uncharacterized protein